MTKKRSPFSKALLGLIDKAGYVLVRKNAWDVLQERAKKKHHPTWKEQGRETCWVEDMKRVKRDGFVKIPLARFGYGDWFVGGRNATIRNRLKMSAKCQNIKIRVRVFADAVYVWRKEDKENV